MISNNYKLCPFCESPMMLINSDKENEESYLECTTCGLKFLLEGFEEKPIEIKEN